jgi:hypothetical protein
MGGAVSLLVNAILFPVDPILMVGRASQPVFLDLGASLDATARGLERGDVEEARAGLERARGLDDEIERLYDAIAVGRDTARLAPAHRRTRPTAPLWRRRASARARRAQQLAYLGPACRQRRYLGLLALATCPRRVEGSARGV